MATSALNLLAAEYLTTRRKKLGMSRIEFALALSQLVGLEVSEDSLTNYELRRNGTPAAILLAAQMPATAIRAAARDGWRIALGK